MRWEERTNERREFRRQHPHRNGKRGAPFPVDMAELPSFSQWFKDDVQTAIQQGVEVPEDVEDSSNLPSMEERSFKSMYLYGYHFRIKSAEGSAKTTCDSGVAAVFRQPCCSGRRDNNMLNADLEYIGQISEIVELNYRRHCIVLLVCDWVKANYKGRNATIKEDEWGFTLANFGSMVPFGYESLAFPIHCQQVFFSDDEEEPGWKVVLKTEVRGHRIDNEIEEEELEMFAMGRDSDFEGLRAATEDPESIPEPMEGGRNIEVQQVFNDLGNDDASLYDRDIGESSKDEDWFFPTVKQVSI